MSELCYFFLVMDKSEPKKDPLPNTPEHLKKYAFQKGNTLNPGGRPKRSPEETAKWIEACKGNREILVQIRDTATKDADRLRAIEILEDRTYGKPVQQVDADVTTHEPVTVDTSKLSDEQKKLLSSLG